MGGHVPPEVGQMVEAMCAGQPKSGPMRLTFELGDIKHAVQIQVADTSLRQGLTAQVMSMAEGLAYWLEDRACPEPGPEATIEEFEAWFVRRFGPATE